LRLGDSSATGGSSCVAALWERQERQRPRWRRRHHLAEFGYLFVYPTLLGLEALNSGEQDALIEF
jgi:hypothetical protein